MSQQWNWDNPERNEHQELYPHSHQEHYIASQGYPTAGHSQVINTPSVPRPPLPSSFVHAINHGQHTSHSGASLTLLHGNTPSSATYAEPSHGYLSPNYTSPYQLTHNVSFGFAHTEYVSRPTSIASNGSPSSEIYDDFDDDRLCYVDSSTGASHHDHQSYPNTSTDPPTSSSPYYMCDHPGCNKACARLCDLRKHKKRHQKPFPCREGCDSYFSTEKDRDRHERSRHRQEERLTCVTCGHRTARKDNMKDHVRRRHGEQDLERIMDATMANAY